MLNIKTKSQRTISSLICGLGACFLLCLWLTSPAQSAPQIELNAYVVGGKNKVADGEYEIRFALYTVDRTERDNYPSDSDESQRVWQETQRVPIKNGLLKAQLGAETALPASLDVNNNEYYLGVRIANDSEMVPRKKIRVGMFSFSALNSVNAQRAQIALDAEKLGGAITGINSGNIPLLVNGGVLDKKMIPKITSLGTISSGTWEGDSIASKYLARALTGKTYNGLTLASEAQGFSITGNSKKLTVSEDIILYGGGHTLTLASDLSLDQDLSTSATPNFSSLNLSSALAIAEGGTGLDSYTAGDLLYYSSGQTFSKLAIGQEDQVLTVTGGVPAWIDFSAAGLETDPIFSASTAAGITATNFANWNTAYGWGNHASAGYLTNLSSLTTDNLTQGTTNLYSQWALNGGKLYYNAGNVGIGTNNPSHLLAVAGNIGISASGYLNFGLTDGSSGYGLRDNNGVIEYKNSGGDWVSIGRELMFSNSAAVAVGDYLEVAHNQGTFNVVASGWIYDGTIWKSIESLTATGDVYTDTSLDYDQADSGNYTFSNSLSFSAGTVTIPGSVEYTTEADYDQENLAANTTLTPSATSGSFITLTLGSGNWNANAKVQKGCRVVGNSGEAVITDTPAAQSTISAYTVSNFANTNSISSGSWQLYCTLIDSGVANLKNYNVVGSGKDSALSPSGTFNLNTDTSNGRSYADGVAYKVNSNPTTTSIDVGTTPNGFASGDLALLINLQGSGADNADVGNYEILSVTGTSGNNITVSVAPTKSYDGSSWASQKVIIQRIPQYTNVTLDNSDKITASAWDALATTPYKTGIVVFYANGSVSVTGSASIDAASLGYRGGSWTLNNAGVQGESYNGTGSNSINNNYGGGGGGGYCTTWCSGQTTNSGGGGGHISSGETADPPGYYGGSTGAGGNSYDSAGSGKLYFGSGGGGGAKYNPPDTSVSGGNGGGIVLISAYSLNTSNVISAKGADTANAISAGGIAGSGGGGGGGTILLTGNNVTASADSILASGGTGGSGTHGGGLANGGDGAVRIKYAAINSQSYPNATEENSACGPNPLTSAQFVWSDFSQRNNPVSQYYTTITSDTTQLHPTDWSAITAITPTQTANSQSIYYALSDDDRTTFKIKTSTTWRTIARNNAGTWQYNSAAVYADEQWTGCATNNVNACLSEAISSQSQNRMDSTSLATAASTPADNLDFAITLYSNNAIQNPQVDEIAMNATTEYLVTQTTDSNQLASDSWTDINSVTATSTVGSGAVKYAVSFDDRANWKYWNGSAWTAIDISSQVDWGTKGMTKETMNAITDAQWESTGGYVVGATNTLDFAVALQMDDTAQSSPTLDAIAISYEKSQYPIRVMDNNTVRIYNNSAGTATLRLNVVTNTSSSGSLLAQGLGFSYLFNTSDDLVIGSNSTASASFWLDSHNKKLRIAADATHYSDLAINPSGDLGISTAQTASALTILNNGNVGIGTADPGTYKLYINGTGYLGGAAAWVYGSDIRLKENISDLGYGLDAIMKLNPQKFDYKTGAKNQFGFIAQEVQKIMPELVELRPDGMLGLKTDMILPVMVNAMQEQQKEIIKHGTWNMEQDKEIGKLLGKDVSLDDKLTIIGKSLNGINEQLDDQDEILADLVKAAKDLDDQNDRLTELEGDLEEIRLQNQELLEFANAIDPENLIYKDIFGNLNLAAGNLEAAGVIAGAFKIKIETPGAATIGASAICMIGKTLQPEGTCGLPTENVTEASGKNIVIKTTAVTAKSKIFVTPRIATDQPLSVTQIKPGESFQVEVKNPVAEDLSFDWFIMEEK